MDNIAGYAKTVFVTALLTGAISLAMIQSTSAEEKNKTEETSRSLPDIFQSGKYVLPMNNLRDETLYAYLVEDVQEGWVKSKVYDIKKKEIVSPSVWTYIPNGSMFWVEYEKK